MDEISQLIEPFLRQPIVVYGVFALMAGVIPAIEELLKPMALWALAGKKISPQEGFVGGLIAGAGFALIENVLYFTNVITAGDWLVVAVGRAGTGILHMLASGIAGWGLAKGWRDRKWWTLIFSTLGAILLHGLWNGLAIASGFLPFMMGIEETTLGQDILYNAPLVILMILSAVGIFLINRHFQKKNAAEIKEDPLLN
jgi:RsiW-degrading membrane proteinase PrsW (M82 family)